MSRIDCYQHLDLTPINGDRKIKEIKSLEISVNQVIDYRKLGVQIAIMFQVLQPLAQPEKIDKIATGISAMSNEETDYQNNEAGTKAVRSGNS